MLIANKQTVRVQRGGRIEVFVPELPEGASAEVTVKEATATTEKKRSLVNSIGQGKGAFSSADEVDSFIRAERDQWR